MRVTYPDAQLMTTGEDTPLVTQMMLLPILILTAIAITESANGACLASGTAAVVVVATALNETTTGMIHHTDMAAPVDMMRIGTDRTEHDRAEGHGAEALIGSIVIAIATAESTMFVLIRKMAGATAGDIEAEVAKETHPFVDNGLVVGAGVEARVTIALHGILRRHWQAIVIEAAAAPATS